MNGERISPATPERRRRRRLWIAGPLVGVVVGVVVGVSALGVTQTQSGAHARRTGPFAWVSPHRAPPGWHRLAAPGGGVTLWYPPGYRPVAGDRGTESAGLGPAPRYTAYLNVTPRQGDERLAGFASFRVHLLGEDDDRDVRELAAGQDLSFGGGTGSAVVDEYTTRVGADRYTEIAALVRGRHGAWVIVAAASSPEFSRYQAVLRRAVDAVEVG